MRRYFFDLLHKPGSTDDEGTEFEDREAACSAAVDLLAGELRESGCGFWAHPDWAVQVRNEAGSVECVVRVTGQQ